MIIRCTQKLLKELRIKPQQAEVVNNIGSWHANLLRIERRKCVLFTHNMTLFSIFVAGLKRNDFDHFDDVFGQTLFKTMQLFDFKQSEIERMLDWSQHNIYTKTNNRSVLGSMNDMAYQIEHYIADFGGLDYTSFAELHYQINHIPYQSISPSYPLKGLKALLIGVDE